MYLTAGCAPRPVIRGEVNLFRLNLDGMAIDSLHYLSYHLGVTKSQSVARSRHKLYLHMSQSFVSSSIVSSSITFTTVYQRSVPLSKVKN